MNLTRSTQDFIPTPVRSRALLSRALRSPRVPGRQPAPVDAPALAGVIPRFTALPAWPFAVAVSPAGETAFVSMPRRERRGIVALAKNRDGSSDSEPWRISHTTWITGAPVPRGLALTRDGRHLLVANSEGGLLVADTARLADGTAQPFVSELPTAARGSMQVVLEPGERFAFVSDEENASVSVFDFRDSLTRGAPHASLIGAVTVPPGPVGLACAADGRRLFLTSQSNRRNRQPGVISVLGLDDAATDPARVRVTSTAAGDTPVRTAVSPTGETVWVTARGSNSLLGFDAERLASGRGRALRAVVTVGALPVGLTLVDRGRLAVVANSNRYGSDSGGPQTLAVIDTAAALAGRRALLGTVATGAFPRELATMPDDRTVLVTNVFSQSLETVAVC